MMSQRIMMTLAGLALLASGLLTTAACVWRTEHKVETVHRIDAHIVLDIRQIKDEADAIEDYVNEGVNGGAASEEGPISFAVPGGQAAAVQLCAAGSSWAWLDPSTAAWAASAEAKITEEQVKDATERRRKRAGKINDLRKKRTLGENDHGYVALLTTKGISQDTVKAAKSLLKAENKDRTVIYLALVQKQGGTSKQLPQVEVIYAQSIREKLAGGQKFRVPRDKKAFQSFKRSKLGKRFADAKPGQWVVK